MDYDCSLSCYFYILNKQMDLSLETAGEGKKNMYHVEIGRERGRMSRMQGKREVEREVRMTKFIHHLFN